MSDNLKILQAMVLLANTLKYSSTYKESLIRELNSMMKMEQEQELRLKKN